MTKPNLSFAALPFGYSICACKWLGVWDIPVCPYEILQTAQVSIVIYWIIIGHHLHIEMRYFLSDEQINWSIHSLLLETWTDLNWSYCLFQVKHEPCNVKCIRAFIFKLHGQEPYIESAQTMYFWLGLFYSTFELNSRHIILFWPLPPSPGQWVVSYLCIQVFPLGCDSNGLPKLKFIFGKNHLQRIL
jgi:hypothetical protein